MDLIVGTAGHIDHGKTALVRALTGINADRLPEEKKRGITIDIGFAELDLGDIHLGFVDVPGHERFVKNMLAGAHGIDLVLLVIAADEGVMPQTREHFDICRLLGLERGIVVLTKSDLVDNETLDLARMDALELIKGSFLQDTPVIAVSSISGLGIDGLKRELVVAGKRVKARKADRETFLPIDRSFTIKGFGTVVTGTLASGEITEGGELELLPEGRKVRVRGLQTHDRSVKKVQAGQRTAVNLGGIEHTEISRGMILAKPGLLRPTRIINTETEILSDAPKPIRSRQRVRVHIGTAEILGRVFVMNESDEIAPGTKGFLQLRLESPAACLIGNRFILRSYSPQQTIGGGRILMPLAEKIRKRDIKESVLLLSAIADAESNAEIIGLFAEQAKDRGIAIADLQAATGWRTDLLNAEVKSCIDNGGVTLAGGRLIKTEIQETLKDRSLDAITAFHKREPLAVGMKREILRETVFRHLPEDIFSAAVVSLINEKKVVADKDILKLAEHETSLSSKEEGVIAKLRALYDSAGLEPPKLTDVLAVSYGPISAEETRKLLEFLVRSGELIKVNDNHYFSSAAIERLIAALRHEADNLPDRVIDIPRFKEIAGVSRKYAIPLLEYLDQMRVTARAGDRRVVTK